MSPCRGTYVKSDVAARSIPPAAASAARAAALAISAAANSSSGSLDGASATASESASSSFAAAVQGGEGCLDPSLLIPGFRFFPHRYLDEATGATSAAMAAALPMTGFILDGMTAVQLQVRAGACADWGGGCLNGLKSWLQLVKVAASERAGCSSPSVGL